MDVHLTDIAVAASPRKEDAGAPDEDAQCQMTRFGYGCDENVAPVLINIQIALTYDGAGYTKAAVVGKGLNRGKTLPGNLH